MDKFKAVIKKIWPYILIAIVSLLIAAFFEHNHKFEIEVTGEVILTKGTYQLEADLGNSDFIVWELFDIDENDGNNYWGRSIDSGECVEPGIINDTFEIVEDYNRLVLVAYDVSSDAKQIGNVPYTVRLEDSNYIDWLIVGLAIAIMFSLMFYWIKVKNYWNIAIIILSMIIMLPYIRQSLIYGHDLNFHLARIHGIKMGLETGQFPVHNNPAFNYGYGHLDPVYYPNLFLYIPALLCMSGMSLLNAYKIFILMVNVATGFVGYAGFRQIFAEKRYAYIAAILWLINPYRITNIYLRAAVGEFLAQIFIPLFFGALFAIIYKKKNCWISLAIGASGILQSHILSVEMTAILAAICLLISIKELISQDGIRIIKNIGFAILITIIANLWFIIPFIRAFFMGGEVSIEQNNTTYLNNAIELWQAFTVLPKMSGWSVFDTSVGDMPFTIGLVLGLGIIIFVIYLVVLRKRDELTHIAGVSCILGIFTLLMSTRPIVNLIQNVPIVYEVIKKIQFPWRFCGYAAFFLTIVFVIDIKYIIESNIGKIAKQASVCCLGVLVGITFTSCIFSGINDTEDMLASRETSNGVMITSDYLETDMDPTVMSTYKDIVVTSEDVIISDYSRSGMNLSFNYTNTNGSDTNLNLPLYDYDGFNCTIDGEPWDLDTNEQRVLVVRIPENKVSGHVEVKYGR